MAWAQPVERRRESSFQLFLFGIWLAVTAVGLWLTPSASGHGTHTQLGLPPCASFLMFGKPCPGCGLTTSFSATVHGDLATAFAAHPMGPVLYLLFTGYALFSLYCWATKRRPLPARATTAALFAVIGIYLVFGVARFVLTPASESETIAAMLQVR